MPIYGDDQCERCGGVRVAKSTLCADCLVKLFNKAVWEVVAQEKEIKKLKKRITRDRGRLEDALAYGFKQNQENIKMLRYIKELEGKTEEGENNEKDRKA